MLEVGNGGMTTEEYRAHFSIWALAKVYHETKFRFLPFLSLFAVQLFNFVYLGSFIGWL